MIFNQTYIDIDEVVCVHYLNREVIISFKNKNDSLMIPCDQAQYDELLDKIEKVKGSN